MLSMQLIESCKKWEKESAINNFPFNSLNDEEWKRMKTELHMLDRKSSKSLDPFRTVQGEYKKTITEKKKETANMPPK